MSNNLANDASTPAAHVDQAAVPAAAPVTGIALMGPTGSEAGLALVDRLELNGYQYFHSTRADLLRRLDRADEARTEYERALEVAHTEAERRFLNRRLAEVSA